MNIHYRVVYRFRASVAELCHWQLMWQHAPCCHCLTLLSCLPACLPSLHSIRFPIHGQPRLISQLKWHHINPILLHSPLPVTYLPFFSSLIGPIFYILFIYLSIYAFIYLFIFYFSPFYFHYPFSEQECVLDFHRFIISLQAATQQ